MSEHPAALAANSISGNVRLTGLTVQAGTVHGGITVSAPSQTRVPWQLPRSTALTDRIAERTELEELLLPADRDGLPLLVVITGPGGVGKTALATAWLRSLRERFPDGQLYADMHAHPVQGPANADEVTNGWLHTFGVQRPPRSPDARAAALRTLTAERRLVLLLDNVASAAQARPLLPTGPSVTVVTSRHRLAGLAMDGGRPLPLDPMDTDAAWDLLISTVPGDRIGQEPRQARELVRRCSGLPLAVLIAAALITSRPHVPIARWAQAMAEPEGRLTTLTIEGDTSMTEHLRLAYDNLPPAAQRLYRLLGLHPGTNFTREAARALFSSGPERDACDAALDGLVSHSLVTEVSDGRFAFHDLVREHAATVAPGNRTGEIDPAEHRLVDYYLLSASRAAEVLEPSRDHLSRRYQYEPAAGEVFDGRDQALEWLDAERSNFRAVIARAEHPCPDTTWQLVDALWAFWLLRRYSADARAAHRIGLAAARACKAADGIGRMLTSFALVQRHHDPDLSLELLEEAEAHFHDLGQPLRAARVLNYRGLTLWAAGRLDEADQAFVRAIAACHAHGDPRTAALAHHNRAGLAYDAGRYERACAYASTAHAALAVLGDGFNAALAVGLWGRAELCSGRPADAEQHLAAAVDGLREAGDVPRLARAVVDLGDLYGEHHHGDQSKALPHYRAALALHEREQAVEAAAGVRARIERLAPGDNE